MKIGIPTEIKVREARVALVPAGARELSADGHDVFVQSGAGAGVGLADADYVAAGATILPDAEAVFQRSRSGAQGEGTAATRVSAAAPRSDALHVSASRRGSESGRRFGGVGCHGPSPMKQ